MIGYSDSDFDGDKETGLSTLSYVMTLRSGFVSLRSPIQSILANSTIEAEYVEITKAMKEVMWLTKILEYLQEKQVHSTPLLIDNTSVINFPKNPNFHD